ncbi:ribonuclease P protein component [Persephonella sp.]
MVALQTLKSKEIKNVLSKGKSLETDHLIIIYQKNSGHGLRYGIIASRRFSKKAVVRNRTKRIIREALRAYYHQLKDMNYDIILIAKKNIIGIKTTALFNEIEMLIKYLREKNGKDSD